MQMHMVKRQSVSLLEYIPLFFIMCFSGNPFFVAQGFSKMLLVAYSVAFVTFCLFVIDWQLLRSKLDFPRGLLSLGGILGFIFLLVFLQKYVLGFVSYAGVLRYVLNIILTLFTVLYYQNREIDFVDTYIKIISFMAFVSIPFFILNQVAFVGIGIPGSTGKSMIIHTMTAPIPGELMVRNSGMFWEPGAYSGYLILGLVFIALKNRGFQIGPYKWHVILITIGVVSTMSTTGYLVMSILLLFYAMQNHSWGKIVLVPLFLVLFGYSYYSFDFMQEKIEEQFTSATEMSDDDVSNTRFGALKMDMQYIQAQPIIGNGLHVKTRFRFHPWIKEDIGHGNGMSNFLACWGIPLFLIWMYCVYLSAKLISKSTVTSILALSILVMLLQGEQFLNYPLFLSFFVLPFAHRDISSLQSKLLILRSYLQKKEF